jgi:hypothetical protein
MSELPSYPKRNQNLMVTKFDPADLVDEFEGRFGRAAAWSRACNLMIDYFSQFKEVLPDVAAHGLDAAVRYQRGELNLNHLVEARIAGRQYLKDQKAVAVQRTPEQYLVRAVALLLTEGPEPQETSGDVIFCLWQLAPGFDSNQDRIASLIKQYFSSEVNG